MRKTGVMDWWIVGLLFPLLKTAVLSIDEGGDGGGGGEPWYGNEVTDAGLKETLSSFESRDAAFAALHENRMNANKPLVDRLVAEDPELVPFKEKLSQFKSPAAIAKSYANLEKKLGANPLVPPGEKATDAEKKAFREQLATLAGRPASPDKYTYKPSEEVVKAGLDMDQFNGRMKQMHEMGLTDEQLSGVMKIYEEEAGLTGQKMQEHLTQQAEEAKAFAKETWGPDADKNMTLAGRAMQKMGVKDSLKASGMINDKGIISAFYQLAQALGEGNLPAENQSGTQTFEEKMAALKKTPGYDNPRHPDYPKLQKQRDDLYRQQYGK